MILVLAVIFLLFLEAQGFVGMPPAPPFALWNPAMHPGPMNQPPATPTQTTAQATPTATTATTATPTTFPSAFPTASAGSPMGQVICYKQMITLRMVVRNFFTKMQ